MQVKVLNGKETVMGVEEAARRLTGLGLRFAGIDSVLGVPYEIEFPFSAGIRSADDSVVLTVKGSYQALLALERRMIDMVKEEEIKAAFVALKTARQALYDSSEKELAARMALKRREASLLLSGAIIGKNAETRDAQLKEGCQAEIVRLEGAETEKRLLQCRFDLANITVNEIQWQIRNDLAIADLNFVA